MFQRSENYFSNKTIVGVFKGAKRDPIELTCPFPQSPTRTFENSVDVLDEYVNMILTNESPSTAAYSIKEIVSHLGKYSDKVHEFGASKIQKFAMDVADGIENLNSLDDIGTFWNDVSSKVNLLSITFSISPASKNCSSYQPLRTVFNEMILHSLELNPTVFQKVADIIITAYNENRSPEMHENIKLAFTFAIESGLFDSVFFPQFISSVIERLQPLVDEAFTKDLSQYLVEAGDLVNKEMTEVAPYISPAALRKLKSELDKLIFTSKFKQIVTNGLPLLVKTKDSDSIKICVDLARDTDQINEFVRRLSHVFEAEADCFKLDNPIERVLDIHSTMLKFNEAARFSPDHVKKIRISFEKGFNSSPDVAARLFALEINKKFIDYREISAKELDNLLDLFKMLACKDVFSSYHAYLLAKRVLLMKEHTIKMDQNFITHLKVLCGPEYTKTFSSIFEDLNISVTMMNELRAEQKIPPWFTWVLFSHESWPDINQNSAEIPLDVRQYTTICEAKALKEKKKVMHCLQLSRVKLSVAGVKGIHTIKCNGLYAAYLLAFNGHQSLPQSKIAKITKLDSADIEEITETLKRKKSGPLVYYAHQIVKINPEASVNNGELNIAFSFPAISHQDDTKTKNAIMQDRDTQVDALVVRLLKQEKSLDREDLKTMLKDNLKFRMDDELFDKRLNSLNKRQFIKLDQSGCVNYLA